jgi:filamentous hemagglutinin family protein
MVSNRWDRFILYLLSGLLLYVITPRVGYAQITLDGSLGPQGPLSGPNFIISADLGQQRGGNLFHSFSQFNLNSAESATFTGPGTVENIIGRVIGEEASFIDGTIRSDIPNANLFLFNPGGMVFGPHARLDVSGSFHVSTADFIRLGLEGRFDATQPSNSVLTVAPPSTFGFLGHNPAPISIEGSLLEIPEGKTLLLVGEDIQIVNGFLAAPGGQVNIASVASAGEVPLRASDLELGSFSRFGNINISQSSPFPVRSDGSVIANVDVSGTGGGAVFIRGGRFMLDRSVIQADTQGSVNGGGIDIRLTEDLVLDHAAVITADTLGSGNAGDILVTAARLNVRAGSIITSNSFGFGRGGNLSLFAEDSISISGFSEFGLRSSISASTFSDGRSGTIFISTPDLLVDGGFIIASTLGNGDAGDITLDVENLTLKGDSTLTTSTLGGNGQGGTISLFARDSVLISESVIDSSTFGNGHAGTISLDVGSLTLIDGGQIDLDNLGAGQGGTLSISARDFIFISEGGIFTIAASSGDAGAVSLVTPHLTLVQEGALDTSTLGSGRAGDIVLEVERLTITRGRINSNAVSGTGQGGQITITATDSVLISRGDISSDTSSSGDAGTISLFTPVLTLEDEGLITASTFFNTGSAGDILLNVGSLTLKGGSKIVSASIGPGQGGQVFVDADVFLASGTSDSGSPSGIFMNAQGSGPGGDIELRASRVQLIDGATLSARSTEGTGNAGNIRVTSGTFRMEGSSVKTGADNAVGGNIQIISGDIQLTGDSAITASVAQGEGSGGNVTLDTGALAALEDSDITASADQGFGGNITINAQGVFFSQDIDLNASSNVVGREGTVEVRSPQLDLSGSLVALSPSFLSVASLFSERCTARSGGTYSSFVVVGRDGIPIEPDGLLPGSEGGRVPDTSLTSSLPGFRSGFRKGFRDNLRLVTLDLGCSKY